MATAQDNLIADLVAPGHLIIFYLNDGSTGRTRAFHDGQKPIEEDVADTLRAAQEAGRLIEVDSLDSDAGGSLRRFIVPAAVVAVVIEDAVDLVAAVA